MAKARVTRLCPPLLFTLVLGCTPAGSGGESETGETETGETETGGDEGFECITDEGTLALTGLLLHEHATLFDSDGSRELEMELTSGNNIELAGAGRGEYVAVARSRDEYDSGRDAAVRMFGRASGQLQWGRQVDGVRVEQMWVSEDGWVSGALQVYESQAPAGFLMSVDEVHTMLSYKPLSVVREGRVAALEVGVGSSGEVGWLTVADMSWVAAQPNPVQSGVRVVDEQTLEYVAQGAEGEVFVRATPGGSEIFEFPGGQLTPMGGRGSYRLMQTLNLVEGEPRWARLDIDSGEVLVIDPELPENWSYLDCGGRSARIDDDGTVLFELESVATDRAAVWAYTPEDDTWTRLGAPVIGVADIVILGEVGDAYAVLFYPRGDYVCGGETNEWLVEPLSRQVVRHEPPLAIELDGDVVMDSEQRCMAHRAAGIWKLRSLSTDAAEDVQLTDLWGGWVWLD